MHPLPALPRSARMEPEEFDATLRAAATAVTPAPERPIVTDNEPFDYAAWMARLGETESAAEIAPSSGEQQESASEAFGRVGAPYLNEAALADLLRCTRMRVTKKLSQTKILRKSSFWPLGELTAEEQAELDAARDQFIAAEPHYRRARAPLDGAREPPAPEPAAKPPAPATVSPESPDPIAPAAAAPVHSGD